MTWILRRISSIAHDPFAAGRGKGYGRSEPLVFPTKEAALEHARANGMASHVPVLQGSSAKHLDQLVKPSADEFSVREIAGIAGLTQNGVRSNLHSRGFRPVRKVGAIAYFGRDALEDVLRRKRQPKT